MLRDDIKDIIKEIYNNNMFLDNFFTNGTLIKQKEDVIATISELFDTVLFVSVDGIGKTHDIFRGVPGSYDQLIEGINILKDYGFRIVINTTLMRLNLQEMEKIYGFCKEIGCHRWRVTAPFYSPTWNRHKHSLGVSLKEEMEVYYRIAQKWKEDKMPFELELGHVLRAVRGNYLGKYTPDSFVCGYYQKYAVVWPNGDLSHCSILHDKTTVVGNIMKDSLKSLWESTKMRTLKNLRVKDLKTEECVNCQYLIFCGAGCRANAVFYGSGYKDKDPRICRIFKEGYFEKFLPFQQAFQNNKNEGM